MATPLTPSRAVVLDSTPSALADGLHTLALGLLETDRESALVLTTARDALRLLAWNRFAQRTNARTMRETRLRAARRHQGWRADHA